MGLDSVDLVVDAEEWFNVRLPDAECERIRTVADLAALILSRLWTTNSGCPTARAFFELRNLLVEHAGIERAAIRPSSSLSELFPTDLRRGWRRMQRHDNRIPPLVTAPSADRALLVLTACLFFGWLTATVSAWGSGGMAVGLPVGIGVLTLSTAVLVAAHYCFPNHLPARIVTVGDLAREIQSPLPPRDSCDRLLVEQRVLEDVRQLTAKVRGIPVSKVHPNSDFVRDLGFD